MASSLQSFEARILTSTFNFDTNFHCIFGKYNHNNYHKQTGPLLRRLAALTTRHYRDVFTKLKQESLQNDRMKREEEQQPSEHLQVALWEKWSFNTKDSNIFGTATHFRILSDKRHLQWTNQWSNLPELFPSRLPWHSHAKLEPWTLLIVRNVKTLVSERRNTLIRQCFFILSLIWGNFDFTVSKLLLICLRTLWDLAKKNSIQFPLWFCFFKISPERWEWTR